MINKQAFMQGFLDSSWAPTATGAGLGVGLGAGLGALLDSSNRWRGAIGGAIGGGVLGSGLGYGAHKLWGEPNYEDLLMDKAISGKNSRYSFKYKDPYNYPTSKEIAEDEKTILKRFKEDKDQQEIFNSMGGQSTSDDYSFFSPYTLSEQELIKMHKNNPEIFPYSGTDEEQESLIFDGRPRIMSSNVDYVDKYITNIFPNSTIPHYRVTGKENTQIPLGIKYVPSPLNKSTQFPLNITYLPSLLNKEP